MFFNMFKFIPKGSYVGLNSSVESSNLSQLQVESDNFDVVVKQGSDSKVEYKLFIKEGFLLSDMIFDVNCNASQIAFTIKTLKNNMSGTLELLIPKSLIDINIICINGDINLSKVFVSSLNLRTINGDIKIITLDGDYKISYNTVNGDISNKKKSLSSSSNRIACSSVNGDITIV